MNMRDLVDRSRIMNDLFEAHPIGFNNDDIVDAFKNAPTIDAVEVVRCKDCKHTTRSKVSPEKIICCLTKMCGTVDPDYFCADGEREIDAEVRDDA